MADVNKNNDEVKEKLKTYKVRIIGRIPKGWVAVKQSIFNGKTMRLARGGIFANLPFWKVKLVKVMEEDNDYKPEVFQDVIGADITLDTVLTTRIVDPIKYYSEHVNPQQRLENLLNSRLRIIVKKYPYSFLAGQSFSLPNGPLELDREGNYFNSRTGDQYKKLEFPEYSSEYENDKSYRAVLKKNLDHDLAALRCELDEFSKTYGLAVVELECKKVLPSEEVQRREEELAAARHEVEIEKLNREKALIKANTTAEADSIRQKKLTDLVASLNKEQLSALRDLLYTSGERGEITKDTASAVVGASVAAQQINENNAKTK